MVQKFTFGSRASPSDDWKTLSTQQRMSTGSESGKDKAAKGAEWVPPFIYCVARYSGSSTSIDLSATGL